MRRTAHSTFTGFLSLLLTIVLGLAVPFTGPMKAGAPQDQSAQGDVHRTTPCNLLPAPPGAANGIDEMCPGRGSSTGIAKGDFNGDGIADLAIGIPGKTLTFTSGSTTTTVTDAGAVQIIYGSAAGLAASGASAVTPSKVLTGLNPLSFPTSNLRAEFHDGFGGALAAGDFDGDGIADLAVGLAGRSDAGGLKGAVVIFYGQSGTGLNTASVFLGPATFVSPVTPNPANLFAATSLTWGDFNGDGVGDLAVASTFTQEGVTYTPGVTVLFGVPHSRLSATGKLHFDSTAVSIIDTSTRPSLILSAGDFNGDNISDLVAASPLETVDAELAAGAVHVLYGDSGFGPSDCVIHTCVVSSQRWTENSLNVPGTAGSLVEFGAALAVGDFNGDGIKDLAIGAPGDFVGGIRAGSVVVIYGAANVGLLAPTSGATISRQFTQVSVGLTAGVNGSLFGQSLAANDFNGDAIADLAIGVPGFNSSRGEVDIIYGSDHGLTTGLVHVPQRFDRTNLGGTTPQAGDLFGQSLTAWNFGRGTPADLAIGVPGAAVGTLAGAGEVYVIYGGSTGLPANGLQIFNENSAGLNNSAQTGDHFGLTVY